MNKLISKEDGKIDLNEIRAIKAISSFGNVHPFSNKIHTVKCKIDFTFSVVEFCCISSVIKFFWLFMANFDLTNGFSASFTLIGTFTQTEFEIFFVIF